MLNKKEIKTKINSIKTVKKITKVMEMIATIKMKKSQKKIKDSTPYIDAANTIISNMKRNNLKFTHPFFVKKKIKKIGLFILSSDKGLCSGFNSNLFKKSIDFIKKNIKEKIKIQLFLFGKKAIRFFKKNFKKSISIHYKIKTIENLEEYNQITNPLIKLYKKNKINQIFIAFNKFKNSITYHPTINKLLPLEKKNRKDKRKKSDYLYEPNSIKILDTVLNHYINIKIYQAYLSNFSSEQSARMLSMKTASDNSNNIIKKLNLNYNKTRQTNITQELTEIISGSSSTEIS